MEDDTAAPLSTPGLKHCTLALGLFQLAVVAHTCSHLLLSCLCTCLHGMCMCMPCAEAMLHPTQQTQLRLSTRVCKHAQNIFGSVHLNSSGTTCMRFGTPTLHSGPHLGCFISFRCTTGKHLLAALPCLLASAFYQQGTWLGCLGAPCHIATFS